MGNYLTPRGRSRRNFARVLVEHGDEPLLRLVDPIALAEALVGKGAVPLAAKVKSEAGSPPYELRSIDKFIEDIAPQLQPGEVDQLSRHALLGTLAAIAYKELRVPFAHRGTGPKALTFSAHSWRGDPPPVVDFAILHRSLVALVANLRRLSESTNRWFGHDFSRAADR
jgi:hypothetical protein